MSNSSCSECDAICEEFSAATRLARAGNSGLRNLSDWVEQLNEEECTRLREESPLWKTWRRWQEHKVLTGHTPPILPFPPGAISNPN
jgi:hypothetical protein